MCELGIALSLLGGLLFGGRVLLGYVAERAALGLPPSVDAKLGELGAKVVTTGSRGEAPTRETVESQARLRRVFDELLASLRPEERAALGSPEARLLLDPTPNAFALPGGKVFVLSGLLDRLPPSDEGEGQLRGVLAHELGHAVRRHALRQLARKAAFSVGLGLILGNGDQLTDTLLAGASQLEQLRHSRESEEEADDFGVDLLRRAGGNAEGLASFLESLGRQPVPDFLSTHPDPEARARRLRHQDAQLKGSAP